MKNPTAAKAKALTSVADFRAAGYLGPEQEADAARVAKSFRLRLSPAMQRAAIDGGDGILAQFVPSAQELQIRPEELADPIGDLAHSPVPGLTHRYPDRVILQVTQTCDVYCRFCFRREAVGQDGPLSEGAMTKACAYLAATPAVREVILTGGDPLTLSPRRLAKILTALAAIPSVEVVRIHTRVPVVAPERISDEMVAALQAFPVLFLVLHTNHASEIGPKAAAALGALSRAGVALLSQSVLLRGVNADADTLHALFRALIRHRVKPYYLHHCDLAKGTSHFRTTIAEGLALIASLRGRLSGIALPTYVLDIPGGYGKVPLASPWLEPGDRPGHWRVMDPSGGWHDYFDPSGDDIGDISSISAPSRTAV